MRQRVIDSLGSSFPFIGRKIARGILPILPAAIVFIPNIGKGHNRAGPVHGLTGQKGLLNDLPLQIGLMGFSRLVAQGKGDENGPGGFDRLGNIQG